MFIINSAAPISLLGSDGANLVGTTINVATNENVSISAVASIRPLVTGSAYFDMEVRKDNVVVASSTISDEAWP